MNRTDLILIFVASVVIAIVLGWCMRWMFDRLNHVPHVPESQDEVGGAKAAQKAAEDELARIQSEFASEYNQIKAELEATMDGLGLARQKSDALQAELDAQTEGPSTSSGS